VKPTKTFCGDPRRLVASTHSRSLEEVRPRWSASPSSSQYSPSERVDFAPRES
jgi:hypothetical protein